MSGRVHQHNVVIASMHEKVDGSVPAANVANVAKDMARTFIRAPPHQESRLAKDATVHDRPRDESLCGGMEAADEQFSVSCHP